MKDSLQRMLDEIRSEAKFTAGFTGREKFDDRVMAAMEEVNRQNFVPEDLVPYAYDNGPLPIGFGQTISQPYIVALMTDLLDLEADDTVLEVGTGSGYQAAILSRIAKRVYSIERVSELTEKARKRLENLGYNNVEICCSNGYLGWQDKAPFDAIIVTAAATHIPPDLLEQLKPDGRMVIPIGLPYMHQELMLVIKDINGETHTESVLGVSFVPLIIDEESFYKEHENTSQENDT